MNLFEVKVQVICVVLFDDAREKRTNLSKRREFSARGSSETLVKGELSSQ